jgi:hypothetical protein
MCKRDLAVQVLLDEPVFLAIFLSQDIEGSLFGAIRGAPHLGQPY